MAEQRSGWRGLNEGERAHWLVEGKPPMMTCALGDSTTFGPAAMKTVSDKRTARRPSRIPGAASELDKKRNERHERGKWNVLAKKSSSEHPAAILATDTPCLRLVAASAHHHDPRRRAARQLEHRARA